MCVLMHLIRDDYYSNNRLKIDQSLIDFLFRSNRLIKVSINFKKLIIRVID